MKKIKEWFDGGFDMNTKFEHIGNLLYEATEKELQIVFNQYMKKMNINKERMLNYFSEIVECKSFDYYGAMDNDYEEEIKG